MLERLPLLFLNHSSNQVQDPFLLLCPLLLPVNHFFFFVGKVGRVRAYTVVEASLIFVIFPPSLLYPGFRDVSLNTW